MSVLKWAVLALVAVGVIQAIRRSAADIRESNFSLSQLRVEWLVASGLFYALAQVPMVWYWKLLLQAFGIISDFWRCLPAFVYGHLGKYVPGKLFVVILRSGLLGLRNEQIPAAASSVFVETFTFMAAGSFAAALGVFALYREERRLQFAALAMMACMMLGTWPPLLRWGLRKARQLGVPLPYSLGESITWLVIARGWCASLLGWALNAASLCAVLFALPMQPSFALTLDSYARALTALAAAVVAGFVSMVPGGLLAREYVLDRLLVPFVGEAPALFAAVLLRLVWILTELVGSTILYIVDKRNRFLHKHDRS